MKPFPSLLAAATLLASAGLAPAEPARSLNDARSQINSGTWPGITLIEARPKAAPAEPPAGAVPVVTAPAPAAPVAAAPGPAAPAPAAAAPAAPTTPAAPATATAASPAATATSPSVAERLRAVLGPPSGVPMNQAARLDSPDRGIVLPTGPAATASGAAK
jgi:hypothetical protein